MADRRIYHNLSNAPLDKTAEATFAVIDRVQDIVPTQQGAALAALAAAFLLMCRRFRVEPQEVFVAAGNMLATEAPPFRAVASYLRNEVQ